MTYRSITMTYIAVWKNFRVFSPAEGHVIPRKLSEKSMEAGPSRVGVSLKSEFWFRDKSLRIYLEY